MIRRLHRLAWMAFALVGSTDPAVAEPRPATTSSSIAIANLDHQLAQASDPATRIELLLAKSRFLGDYDALDEAVTLAESLPMGSDNLMLRARARSAVHRFDDAMADLQSAHEMGADMRRVARQRATILIATGHASEALPALEAEVAARPDYGSHSALASAYAELGRYREADREYRTALDGLRTTSPFPYAWIHFVRGLMWSEQAGDGKRGEAEYAQALAYLPEFAVANIHKAELEFARGDMESAAARLERVAETANEPEAFALLGEVRRHSGDQEVARYDIDAAHRRYEYLLDRQPLAFADHAAEFYLGPGANPARAWYWAGRNLANRATPRAFLIAIRAGVASGHDICELVARMESVFDGTALTPVARAEWERRAAAGKPDRCR